MLFDIHIESDKSFNQSKACLVASVQPCVEPVNRRTNYLSTTSDKGGTKGDTKSAQRTTEIVWPSMSTAGLSFSMYGESQGEPCCSVL